MKKIITLGMYALLLASSVTSAGVRGTLDIYVYNNGFATAPSQPGAHRLTYFVTNLENEEIVGNINGYPPVTLNTYSYGSVSIASHSKEILSAHLKIIDPDADAAVVWEGDVIANPNDKSINTVIYNNDTAHYNIEITKIPLDESYRSSFLLAVTMKK